MKTAALRYTVQIRNGLRWRTFRTFSPSYIDYAGADDLRDGSFALASKMAEIGARRYRKSFRVLLMPLNILATEFPA